jgi:protein phosphatase
MPLTLRYVARSDPGLVREGNEDSGYAGPYLLAVADGMGGHAAGEVASRAAIEELVQAEADLGGRPPLDALGRAIVAANNRIRELITDDSTREGMGTTVTAFFWTGEALAMGHIGDSRGYLLHDGELRQITHDHTFVQSLVDEGRITREEAGIHPARSLILKALQGQGEVDPDLEMVMVAPGDRLLVCSDGLDNASVPDEAVEAVLASTPDLTAAADELIQLALSGGAPDNVTVVLAEVVDTDVPPSPDDTAEAFLVGAAADDETYPPEKQRRRPGAALREMFGVEEKPSPEDLEAMRYAPRPPRRFRWVRPVMVIALVGVVVWAGLQLARDWVDQQYFVAEHDGQVAIYRGVSQEVGPVRLSDLLEEAGGLPVEALPSLYRGQIDEAITARNLDDAYRIVASLRRQACLANMRTPTPEPSPSAAVTPSTPAATPEASPAPASTTAPAATTPPATPEETPAPSPTPDFPGLDCSELP